jgi:tetratricopeptide (TPR) repeat protein
MPITDDDAPVSRRQNPILEALDLDSLSLEGLAAGDNARTKRQRALIVQHAEANDVEALGTMLDALGTTLKTASLEAQVLFAERVDRAAAIDDRLFVHAGFALVAAGYQLWCAKRNAEALPYYERAAQRLADSTLERPLGVWGDAMVARAVLVRDRSVDETRELILQLIERSERIEHRQLRYWAIFGARRGVEQLQWAKRWADSIELAKKGLALPFAHLKPIPSWFESRVFLHSRAMLAHRELEQYEPVIALARASERDCEGVTSDAGLLEVCWILTEAAFVAAERMGKSSLALDFITMMRDRMEHPKAQLFASEIAYALAMEAKARQLMGRSDDALRSCELAIAWAQRPTKIESGYTAHCETLGIRGAIYDSRGERELARAAWREVIERFGAMDDASLRPMVAEAKASLGRG